LKTGDLTGWDDGSMFVRGPFSGTSPHSGNFQAVTAIPGDFNIFFQTFATTPGQSYTIDCWVAGVGENPGDVEVLFGFQQDIVFQHSFDGPTAYTEFTGKVTASSASGILDFVFTVGFDSFALLDDVSVNPSGVGVPDGGSTVSLFGCALLGLAALQRKLSCEA
jgi:hypothetical protein